MKKFISLQLILLLLFAQSIVLSQTKGQIRNSGSGNFEDAAIWQIYSGSAWVPLNRAPVSTDSLVKISSGTTVTINSLVTVDELFVSSSSTVTISAGSNLNVVPGPQTYELDVYGTINGTGTISLQSGAYTVLEGGTLSGSLTMTINFGATFEPITNPSSLNITVNNYGTITQAVQSFNGTGTVNNYANYTVANSFALNIIPNFNNFGTFTKTGIGNFSFGGLINNQSTININGGRVIYDPTTNAGINIWNGSTVIASGATFQVGGYWNYKINVTGSLSGAGDVAFYGGTDTIKANYNISGNTIVVAGLVFFPPSVTYTNIGKYTQSGGVAYWLPGTHFNSYHSDFTLSGGTLYMNSGRAYTFNNVVLAGVLDGTDSITINTSLNWTNSGFNNTGILTLSAGCTTTCISNAVYNYRTLNNNGLFTWTGSYFNGTGTFNNYGTMDLKSDFGYSCNNLLNNFGTVNKLTNNTNNFSLGCNNSGIINVPTGGLSFIGSSGTFSIAGTINIAAGCSVSIGGGGSSATFNCTGTIAGAGTVSFGSATVNISGIYNITGATGMLTGNAYFLPAVNLVSLGSFAISGGVLNFNQGVVLPVMPSVVTIAAGTVKFNTGSVVNLFTLNLYGTLDGGDTVKVNTACTVDHGTFSGSGITILKQSCTTQLINSLCFFSRTVVNEGSLTATNMSIGGSGLVWNKGTFTYNSNGTYISPPLTNDGLFIKTGTGTLTMYGETNNDSIIVSAGTYYHYFNSFTNSGKIIVQSGATFQTGTSLTNNGTFETATGANVTGNYTVTNNNAVYVNNGVIATANTFNGNSQISGSGTFSNSSFTVNGSAILIFSTSHQLKNLTINAGGRCFIPGVTLQLNGTGTLISNSGTFSTGGSIIEYNGSAVQTVSVTNINYDGLSVNNSAGVTLPSAKSVNTLYLKSGTFTVSSFLTLSQNGIIYRGNGALNGTPVFTNNANCVYNGTSAVTTGTELPVLPVTTGYIQVNDSAGVTLTRNITVKDSVVFVSGNLYTGIYSLTVSTNGRLYNETAVSSLQGTFNYSESVSAAGSYLGYAGISLQYGGGSLGTVTLTRYTGAGGVITVGANSSIRRKFVLSSQFPLVTGRNIFIDWHSGDDNGKVFSPSNKAVIWQQINGKWKAVSAQTDVSTNRMIGGQGITSLTTFTVSDSAHPLAPTLYAKFIIQGRYQDGFCLPDTVLGYLVQANSPYSVLDTCVAVYNYSGVAVFNFSNIINSTPYYFCLKGRNFIPTWSSLPVVFSNDNSSWDFSTSADKAYGNNQIFNGNYAQIYTGDINQDGIVDLTDLLAIDNDNANFAGGYIITDLNGDFVVDLTDLLFCDNNNAAFVGSIPPSGAVFSNKKVNRNDRFRTTNNAFHR